MKILLISGTGLLGSVLTRELPRLGVTIRATARKGALPFDLERAVAPQLAPVLEREKFTHAVLVAAMAGVDECFRNPAVSRRVNVEGPRELFALLRKHGVAPVFFSTDLVFDCATDFRREDDPTGPLTLYARQKLETEAIVREGGEHLIFRTSKLMTTGFHPRSIITPIVRAGRGEAKYLAFRDQYITPVFAEDVARALAGALEKGLKGTYHIAGPDRFSRIDFAHRVCQELGLDPSRIDEGSLLAHKYNEPRGACHTLSADKLRRALGFTFTPLSDGLKVLKASL